MRKVTPVPVVILAALFWSSGLFASIVAPTPANGDGKANLWSRVISLRSKEVEKILGRRLSLKEKIQWKILRWYSARHDRPALGPRDEASRSETALVLGIVAIVTLFIPYAVIVSIPCAIAALIIGYAVRREHPENKKARTAIVLGWVSIALAVLALVIAVAVLASLALY